MERYRRNAAGQKRVTVIPGDGIGPEVVAASRRIIAAAGVDLAWEEREAGAAVFKKGLPSGVPPETIESIRETRVVLKGPLETPVGYGEKSANVTLRKLFETYGNLRPVRELPGVQTRFSGAGVDLVIVRENVEDLYAGIEHQQTPGVAQCLKLMSRAGCERIVRLAFEVARSEGRRSVHCATKANIMKHTEGLLKRTFEEVAREYPDIAAHHIIVDNCAHQLVRAPEQFEVIVTSNMNGDILSDLTSGLIGGLGFAPGANLGNEVAIFEAVHGSAPKYAGKDVINPTAVVLSAVMMLRHLDEAAAADTIENAVLATLEAGIFTRDVKGDAGSVGTSRFTDAVIARLGRRPEKWKVRERKALVLPQLPDSANPVVAKRRRTVGMDVFVESTEVPGELGLLLTQLAEDTPLRLKMISNRGTQVFPATGAMTACVDHWRCRFVLREPSGDLSEAGALQLLERVGRELRWMHVEKLAEFDGALGYTRAQGED
ncbi:MAG: NADP-dependent isocitrate dehydrogenase [Deltaproteobacteria bacterium]|nr:NADP-dependent isocitrate dehydrogenase [Deltaproteobacteria bacterium]